MNSINMICEFTNLNMIQALELPHDVFLLTLRNCIIKSMNSSKEGREQLKLWKILHTTTPDYDKIRNNNYYCEG